MNGRFSANRDRGVFVPRSGVELPDFTYLRAAMQPGLIDAAVGRRVDGRKNEYTKIYPGTAEAVTIALPVTASGAFDFAKMAEIGAKLRRIDLAQDRVRGVREQLSKATFAAACDEPFCTLSLADDMYFDLTIGERVLQSQFSEAGIPVYSANARNPFGTIEKSNLSTFDRPSLLWGIDGVFDWNLVPAGHAFATTDRCGRLQLKDERLDPEYFLYMLRASRSEHGFDRVFRASLTNVRAVVEVPVPLGEDGEISLTRQLSLAEMWRQREGAHLTCLAALEDVLQARLSAQV
ncbi:MAG TPA: hypothetical protein VFP72_06270 [Kineosporiaceae bacterium]|nr:hypothetical protein [Kineosporiaceae bacterium]